MHTRHACQSGGLGCTGKENCPKWMGTAWLPSPRLIRGGSRVFAVVCVMTGQRKVLASSRRVQAARDTDQSWKGLSFFCPISAVLNACKSESEQRPSPSMSSKDAPQSCSSGTWPATIARHSWVQVAPSDPPLLWISATCPPRSKVVRSLGQR